MSWGDIRYKLHFLFVKPRNIRQVQKRYLDGHRHMTTIVAQTAYDDEMAKFIYLWVKHTEKQLMPASREEFNKEFVNDVVACNRTLEVDMIATCAHYCYQEHLNGLRWELVEDLYDAHDSLRQGEFKNITNI